jgi:hypothetical protein
MAGTQTFTVSPSSLTPYTNKTILITGGSSGIGLSTALLLHGLGNNIVILDRSAPISSPQTDALTSSPRYLVRNPKETFALPVFCCHIPLEQIQLLTSIRFAWRTAEPCASDVHFYSQQAIFLPS